MPSNRAFRASLLTIVFVALGCGRGGLGDFEGDPLGDSGDLDTSTDTGGELDTGLPDTDILFDTFDPPPGPAVIDQKGCIYRPRILGVRVGQPIEVVNSDPTMHNVHGLPMKNNEFNHAQHRQGDRHSEVFTVPEVMVRFKCDVHQWMAAYVGVLDHPYFAVTDASGAFELPNLPPGTYTIEAWHEKLDPKTVQVTIAAGQKTTLPITLTGPVK